MTIEPISQSIWPEILEIQAQAYADQVTESLPVLQSKWRRSPQCCFVCKEKGKAVGYLLAHAWYSLTPPKLHELLPQDSDGSILLLHDCAIGQRTKNRGVGSEMVTHLFESIQPGAFELAMLVSIQNSSAFWRRHGFSAAPQMQCSNYGKDAQVMLRKL